MREYLSLTGIRAIAAYMVFIHHYLGTNCTGDFWCPVVLELHSGVAIFFVLSGFLITLRYYQSSSINFTWLKNYYISRFARIYPLFFLITLVTLIVLGSTPYEWLLSLSFLKGLSSEYKFIVISQTWTLTVEVIFYFLAPFLFIINKKNGSFLLQFLLIFLIGVFITTGGNIGELGTFIQSHLFLFSYTFFGRSFEFLVGIALALLILRKPLRLTSSIYTYIGLLGIVLTITLISSFQSPEFRYGVFSPVGLLIHNLLLPMFIGIMFLGLIAETTLVSSFLSGPVMNLLGKSSYAFYLIHFGVLADLIPGFFRFNMLTFFIMLNLIAVALYFLIEKPLNTGIKKLATRARLNIIQRHKRLLG